MAETKALVPMGHEFYLDEYGGVDIFFEEYDHHNGPGCALCNNSWCHHCEPEVYTEPCPVAVTQPKLI